MTTKFFTNEGGNTLLKKFEGILEHNPHISELDILVGYFRSTGFFHLLPHLGDLKQVRILVGINVDELTARANEKGTLYLGATRSQVEEDFSSQFSEEIENSNYDKQTEDNIQQFVQDIKSGRIEMRAHPSRKLHAKVYIFRPQDFNEHNSGEVITGSSNLSATGLGAHQAGEGYEFNVALREYEDIKFATDEFLKMWEESEAVTANTVEAARNSTYLRDDVTSEELFYKLLIEYFGKEIDYDPDILNDLPEDFRKLEYQAHAVQQGYQFLEKHNGFFLADVVGLGKTLVATMIARKFYFANDYPDYQSWTLIVYPPILEHQWRETIGKFRMGHVEYISSGSLHKVRDPGKYDLVIIDEAHKFRNSDSDSYSQLQRICKIPTPRGEQKKVILISATPLNNKPDDIKNQLLLFQDLRSGTLDTQIGSFFGRIGKQYDDLMKMKGQGIKKNEIEEIYEEVRTKILEPVTVRRTRSDLQEYYSEDLASQGIIFPKMNKPEKLLYELPGELDLLYEKTRDMIANKSEPGIQYARYRLLSYLKPELQKDYHFINQHTGNLAAMMKTLLLKRLDSSFYAFYETLSRFVNHAEIMDKMVQADTIYIDPTSRMQNLIEAEEDDKLDEVLEDNPGMRKYSCSDFELELFEVLTKDKEALRYLKNEWGKVVDQDKTDPKLASFLIELDERILLSERNPAGKLIIFSESRDTTKYLEEQLLKAGYKALGVTSEDRTKLRSVVEDNFNASIHEKAQADDYDILISTDALSEGINLHRANSIVNYDTPWNSTRLMQRVGRINRIDGNSNEIYIYNFFPTSQVEGDIALRERAAKKLHAFHFALGTDSQIYTDDEDVASFGLFDRDISDEEEPDKKLGYLLRLREWRKENPDDYKRIKDMPLRMRNAVTSKDNATLCFVRASRSDQNRRFYGVAGTGKMPQQITDLAFLEFIKVFENHLESARCAIPNFHYEHIATAEQNYLSQVQVKYTQDNNSMQLSPIELRALGHLKALLKCEIINEEESRKVQLASSWIELGRSQTLTKEISGYVRLQKKNQMKLAIQLDDTVAIIDKHIIDIGEHTTKIKHSEEAIHISKTTKPEIVISQSYLEEEQ